MEFRRHFVEESAMWWSGVLFCVFLMGWSGHVIWQIKRTEEKIKKRDMSDSDTQVGGVK